MNLNIPLHSLSPKELEIMQYVHEHSDAIVSMSIQTFAQEINYSHQPSFVSAVSLDSVVSRNLNIF